MFDRIAPRYDFLNRVLSLGLDVRWRKRMRAMLPEGEDLEVLDVATGTADVAIELAKDPRVTRVVGVDIAKEMLKAGEDKVRGLPIELKHGDAQDLSSYAGAFDVVTISFGIRNVEDTVLGLTEMRRALKPGGRCLILEFGEPEGPIFGPVYRGYRKYLLPAVGGVVSGDRAAYTYLDETIATFPSGEGFLALMREAGFENARCERLTFGTVLLYIAQAPEQTP